MLQPRTALKPGTSPTGLARDPSPTSPTSAAAPSEATAAGALMLLHLTPAVTAASAGVLPSRVMASSATSATGSARVPFLLPPRHREKVAGASTAPVSPVKEVTARGRHLDGVRAAPRASVDLPVVSSSPPRAGRSMRGSPLPQTRTTSGGRRCAPMLHPHLAHPRPAHPRLLLPWPAALS